MIRITGLKLPINHTQVDFEKELLKKLKLKSFINYEIIRKSFDGRKRDNRVFAYTVDVAIENENSYMKKNKNKNLTLSKRIDYVFPNCGEEVLDNSPIIIGSGPAGLFCTWYLAKSGYKPILLERGDEAKKRQQKVESFWEGKTLNLNSNVQFGEGGAGTFSDGKLNTQVKDPYGRNREVLKRFVSCGAKKEILYEQKPHIGTDVLIDVVVNMRNEIISMGGEVYFNSKVENLIINNNKVEGVILESGKELKSKVVVCAIGHSARDTFYMLRDKGIKMEQKSFAVGFRIEHPQEIINEASYHETYNELLGAASYKLTYQSTYNRGVYSFCMCPGGYVVNASSEKNSLAVNGMSYSDRSSNNANSAIICTIGPKDFGSEDVLAGIEFQRSLEKKTFNLCKGKVPVQLFEDFKKNKQSEQFGEFTPCIKGQYELSNLRGLYSKEIEESIIEAVDKFGNSIKGFNRPDAILSGVESRTSSPVRIIRDENKESNIKGLYPCGEGAGYAGGITSAAMDGLKVAEEITRRYKK